MNTDELTVRQFQILLEALRYYENNHRMINGMHVSDDELKDLKTKLSLPYLNQRS